jgi:lambda family phage minor tail protein L
MSRALTSGFISQKDSLTNVPIRLYIIEGGSLSAGEILRYAEWAENITFASQLYYCAPIKCEAVTENSASEIDNVTITFGNVDRSFVHYLESHDGLRKCKVTIRTVFQGTLSDATAFTDDIFYVASASMTSKSAIFLLKSKMDLLGVSLPLRRFYRSTCQWGYKSTECGSTSALTTCNHSKEECSARGNLSRFGGFPGAGSAVRRLYVG